jgi:hypothetical protein
VSANIHIHLLSCGIHCISTDSAKRDVHFGGTGRNAYIVSMRFRISLLNSSHVRISPEIVLFSSILNHRTSRECTVELNWYDSDRRHRYLWKENLFYEFHIYYVNASTVSTSLIAFKTVNVL